MNNSKMIVAALVLMVAIPIMLGYAMAVQEVEKEGWQTTDQVNLTDLYLNYSSPYYMTSTAVNNNSEMLISAFYPGSGVTETSIMTPQFLSVSDNYSSIPEYATYTDTYALTPATVITTTGTDMGGYTALFYNDVDIKADCGLYNLTASQLTEYHTKPANATTTNILALQVGAGRWDTNYSGYETYYFEYGYYSNMWAASDRNPTYGNICRPWTELNIDYDYSADFGNVAVAVRIQHTDSTFEYVPQWTGCNIVKSGNVVLINGVSYGDVSKVAVAPSAGFGNTLTYKYTLPTGNYADPAYGWTIPTIPGAAVTPYWLNGQINESVDMAIYLDPSTSVSLYPKLSAAPTSYIQINRSAAGDITLSTPGSSSVALGNYGYIYVHLTGKAATVSGLGIWPVMGSEVAPINTKTLEFSAPLDNFSQIQLNAAGGTYAFRVDRANIMAGTFPSTYNATVNLQSYWPNTSFAVMLNSVGIYGDSITFNGGTYSVNKDTGKMAFNNTPVLNAVFSAYYDADTGMWINSINGEEISRTAGAPSFGLNGHWSATVAGYRLEPMTGTELEWMAGEFAFNGMDSNFALIGLMGCIGVFIFLGLYGRRSGAKVLPLMIACGAVGFVFLLMI